jgi:predicted DNA-binding transcriptional regulator AlpA
MADTDLKNKDVLTLEEFCSQNGICVATFYNLKKIGKAPRSMKVGWRRFISIEAAAAWRRQMEAEAA